MRFAGLALFALAACREPTCESLIADREWSDAVGRCGDDYQRSRDPSAGLHYAMALTYTGRKADAAPIAERLLAEPSVSADAAYLAGDCARSRGDLAHAMKYLALAHTGHAADPHKSMRDAHQLAGVLAACGEYSTALRAVADGEAALALSPDPTMAGYLALARADLLRRLGDDVGAQQALAVAATTMTSDADLAWLEFKRAVVDLDNRRYAPAEARLRAIHDAPAALRPAIAMQRAWLADQAGRLDEASGYLAGLDDPSYRIELAYARAFNARERGKLDEAARELAAIDHDKLLDEWAWDIPIERASLAEARGDREGAKRDFTRAIDAIEDAQQRDRRMLPSRMMRRAYEGLFTIAARDGRWDDALAVLIRLDHTQLGDVSAAETPWGSHEAAPVACEPTQSTAPKLQIEDSARALRELGRDAEIVIAVIADGSLWRIEIGDKVRGRAIATRAQATALIARITVDPDDVEASRQLGELLIPASTRTDALYLAPLGELAAVPLASLRSGGKLAIATRPIVRLAPISAPDAAIAAGGPSLVLGDPAGDLPAAQDEARWVATALAVDPTLGARATADAFLTGHPAVLHVAAHAGFVDREARLELAGGALGPAKLEQHDWRATKLAVIATCGSAAAIDAEGRGSLAQALLRGGVRTVLASLWSVDDAAAEQVVRAFYRAGGVNDPARALATAQLQLSSTLPTRQWAAFVLLGRPSGPRPAR